MKPTRDQEFSNWIDPPTPTEKQQLTNNLLTAGRALNKLITWKGLLLDGHTRLEICEQYNLPYETEEIELGSREEALAWIIKHQLGRRNWNESQRAMYAARLTGPIGSRAQERNSALSVSDAAKQANVGVDTIKDARKVLANGAPEIVAAVRNGKASVSDAAKVADLPHHDQVNALKKKKAGKTRTLKAGTETREQRLKRLSEEEKTPFQKLVDAKKDEDLPDMGDLTDSIGLIVRNDAHAHFLAVKKFHEAIKLARHLGRLCHEIASGPGGRELRAICKHFGRGTNEQTHSLESLRNTLSELKFATPYASVCPYCWTEDKVPGKAGCKACKGEGWLTEQTWKSAPEGSRARVQVECK